MNKRVYCHTNYFDLDYPNLPQNNLIENNWYVLTHETDDLLYIQHFEYGNLLRFCKKNSYTPNLIFSKFFYTEQEYNRIKNLNDLLNE